MSLQGFSSHEPNGFNKLKNLHYAWKAKKRLEALGDPKSNVHGLGILETL